MKSTDDFRLLWLKEFLTWSLAWESMKIRQRQGILSNETVSALKRTITSSIALSEYY